MNKNSRILIVDDDIGIRKTLSLALFKLGYFVDSAETGEEAILKTDKDFFHLAIIDYRLTDIVGTKFLSLLRVTVPRMRKVLMTGYPMVDNAIDAINRGVDGYLTKPVNMEQLFGLIEQLLEKQAKEKQVIEQKLLRYLNNKLVQEKAIAQADFEKAILQGTDSRLRLRIGDCDIPRQLLLYVFESIGSSPVSFGGVAYGDEGESIRRKLTLLGEEKAIVYEAIDQNGLTSNGLCKIEELKFEETPTFPIRIKFSGNLTHPFI